MESSKLSTYHMKQILNKYSLYPNLYGTLFFLVCPNKNTTFLQLETI